MWFALQVIHKFGNPPLVIATDRRQLDTQIHDTFGAVGFPDPLNADDAKELAKFLENPKGKTIMTTIQKFGEISAKTDERVVVLVDEAHRTQFGKDANAMSNALPNGIFFGFTGTPIDKEDKSTFRVFGKMLDQYGFEESKADGATLPIRYVGKMPRLFVEGEESIDDLFERIIGSDPNITEDVKVRLKKEYVTKGALSEAPSRIKKIAYDLFKHYTENIEPNGYKAMIVAPSREAAVIYQNHLEFLKAPKSKIVMDLRIGEKGKDGKSWDDYYMTDKQKRQFEDSFITPSDETKIVIVVDMLLVGFDAPIVQVMYLDKGIREHNLLQAIARVNRPYDAPKDHGLIVDYCGITKEIQKAFEIFNEKDIKGALEPDDNQLEILDQRYKNAMAYFSETDIKNDEEITEHFEAADIRDKFEDDFKALAKQINALMYKKETTKYMEGFGDLCNARNAIRNVYADRRRAGLSVFAPRIQKLIDDAIRARKPTEIVPDKEITYENFLAYAARFKSPRARTAVIKNRAMQVIRELAPNNPAYYEKLWERLEKLIKEEEERRKNNAKFYDPEIENKYTQLYKEMLSEENERKKVFGDYEAVPFEFTIYGELLQLNDDHELAIKATKEIFSKIKTEKEIVGWKTKTSVEKNLNANIYDILTTNNYPEDKIGDITEKLITMARNQL